MKKFLCLFCLSQDNCSVLFSPPFYHTNHVRLTMTNEVIQMCNYKDYTEKDFDMSSSNNLYPEEETNAIFQQSL